MFRARILTPGFAFSALHIDQYDISHWKPHLFADRDRFLTNCDCDTLDAVEKDWLGCVRDPQQTAFAKLANDIARALRCGIERGWFISADRHDAQGAFLYKKAEIISDNGLLGAIRPRLDKKTGVPIDDEPHLITVCFKAYSGAKARRSLIERAVDGRLLPRCQDSRPAPGGGFWANLQVGTPVTFGLAKQDIDGELRWVYDRNRVTET